MDLTVRDLARMLDVSERTVQRWIEKKGLPAYRLHEQYRLNRVEVQEWAAEHGVSLPRGLFSDPSGGDVPESLVAALELGGIHYRVPGTSRDEVLRSIVSLPGIPEAIDRKRLHQLLLSREALSSTGFGGGIAIPHPRNPVVLRLQQAIAMICFLEAPVDFDAIDRKPVRVLFPLLSPSVKSHLHLLSELSHALHDTIFRKRIEEQAAPAPILERLRTIEGSTRVPVRKGRSA
jgi:PTS system nitrogen regulatory IIA component